MTERAYLSALQYVRDVGMDSPDRTGTGTRWAHGVNMKFWLSNSRVPLLQSKAIDWKIPLDELLWIIHGGNNIKDLNSHIWDAWADEDGDLGPIYGVQWRGFGYCSIDQLGRVIEELREDPYSRRHVVSAWIPDDIDDMALPPCHTLFQFNVDRESNLYCSLYMRSGDMFLGVPFNIFEYGVLTHMVAKLIGVKARQLSVYIANAHIYSNHMDQVNRQLSRGNYKQFPTLKITGDQRSINDFKIDDFIISGYDPLPRIAAPVSA